MVALYVIAIQKPTVDARSPAQIARAIVRVNKAPGRTRTGLDVLWKLYYATDDILTRAELEQEFGVLENHFGLFCRRVAGELGADDPDSLALVNSSPGEDGRQVLTLKPCVVAQIRFHAFSK
jgi:hypothetical protein